jgi:predicted dienelactone hydrolase
LRNFDGGLGAVVEAIESVGDADVLKTMEPMPLVIISHGYPGNRYLMSHLGEDLASKGYVVASIDHRDSTYDVETCRTGGGVATSAMGH